MLLSFAKPLIAQKRTGPAMELAAMLRLQKMTFFLHFKLGTDFFLHFIP
jgi:hypothetical protein